METQTRFDLNTAIENWRAELAAQSDLTADMRRELETHLRDSIAELRQRGLSDEEAFWVARKRVGKPGQLGEEFVKVNPSPVWRERVFWMILGVYVVGIMPIIANMISSLFGISWDYGTGPSLAGWVLLGARVGTVVVAFLLGMGKMPGLAFKFSRLIEDRFKLAGIGILLFLISAVSQYFESKRWQENIESMQRSVGIHTNVPHVSFAQIFPGLFSGLIMVMLLVLLTPARKGSIPMST